MKTIKIITAILMVVLLLNSVPFTASATSWGEGDTLESALSQLKVGFHDTRIDWLVLPNLGVINQRYTYFMYRNERTGQIEEHPVYCIDPTKGGAHEIVSDIGTNNDGSKTATYIRSEKAGDYKYRAIMTYGYPHMRLDSLGLQTKEEGYYATKVALWMYIRGNNPNALSINPAYGNSNTVALRVREAAIKIYDSGMKASPTPQPQITLTGIPRATAVLDTAGEYYVQQVEVVASGWIGTNPDTSGDVQLSWESSPPTGTIVLGSKGEDITSALAVATKADNGRQKGQITIKYPASAIDAASFVPPVLRAEALVPNDDIYIAYADAGKEKYQRYLVEADPKTVVTATFVSQLVSPETFPDDSTLRIRKVQSGTNIPLEGAVFEVRDPEGKLIYSLATNENGTIDIPLSVSGNYTVTEITPPEFHSLSTNNIQSVFIKYGEVAEITFTNPPYGSLRVVKRDASNGMPLGGAAVRIRNITTNATQERTTDSSGCAVFEKLPTGAYEIVEITAPDGYALGKTIHTVNVLPLSEGETSYTLTNKANPGLRITKFDRQTMTAIAGVTFEVWHGGELFGTYVTDVWGEIELRNIPAGTYTVREVATIPPYVLDTTAQWIEIKSGQGHISELIFFNLIKPGIFLTKIDSETYQPLVNARFIIKQVGCTFSKEFTTDANGEINLTGLEPGAYSVQEITAPNGYLIDDAIRTIQINPGENAQFVFTNTRKPILEVRKYDGTNFLPGATFRIARIADGSHYLDRITDENGRIRIDGLEPGIYSVREMSPPPNYILNETEYHIELFPGKTSQLVVNNVRKPGLRILKVDIVTGEPLPLAEFRVSKVEGLTVSEYITDETGLITIEDLDVAIYEATEFMPPDGYIRCDESKQIQLEAGKTKTLKFDNIRKPVVIFLKTNALTGKGIPGATFMVEYQMPGGGMKNLGNYKTGVDGRIFIPKAESGWYVFTEILPAPGSSLPSNPVTRMYFGPGDNAYLAEFDYYYTSKTGSTNTETNNPPNSNTSGKIEEHSGSEYYIEGEGFNWPLNSIVIKKTHAITGELLAGAAFELYRADGQVSGIPGTAIGRYTTDNSGIVVIIGLEPGYYVVKEVQAPQNFLISENSQQNGFLKSDGTTVLEYTFANYPYGSLLISKVDALTGIALAGAHFKVTDASGAVVGNTNGEYVTDSRGDILIPNLKPGAYVVMETQAPANYTINTTPQTVQIGTDGKTYKVTFDNYPYGSLLIVKVDGLTGTPLAGTRFKVTDDSGAVVSNSNGEYVTDSRGEILIPNVKPGAYIVTEIQAPPNYAIITTPQTVHVGTDGKTYKVTFDNYPYGSLLISKVDGLTGAPLANARFKVMDSSDAAIGNSNGEHVTDSRGEILLPNIKPGAYVVTEIQAPKNYAINTTPQTIQVGADGKTYKVTFDNYPYGSIILRKLDSVTHKLLTGAEFRVTTTDGSVVGTSNGVFRTDATGTVTISNLPKGSYIITETTAPDGYILENQSQTVSVEYGKTYTIDMYNNKMSGAQIIKIDADTKQPLKGAKFTVYKMNGEIVGTYETNSDGVIILDRLESGWYKAVETKAPDGWLLDDTPQDFQIISNQFIKLVFENRIMASLQIKKLDEFSSTPLAGATFEVRHQNGEFVGEFTTDQSGTFSISGVKPGWYIIKETTAPQGYILTDAAKTVEVKATVPSVVTVTNRPLSGLKIIKLDSESRKPIGGVEFSIAKMSGEKVLNEFNGYTFKTDKTGQIFIPDLADGYYTITETKAASRYTIDAEPKTVLIQSGKPTVLEVLNTPQTGFRILKIDSITKQAIFNVEFMVFDKNGTVVGTFYTDNNGVVDYLGDIPQGRYTIRETRPADNYYNDDVPRTIEIKAGQVTEIRWENVPKMGQIQILKKSGDDNQVNGLPVGTPLASAIFEAYDYKTANLVDRFVSGSDGRAVSKPLPLGRYIIREVQAPQYYRLSDKTLDVEIEFATQILKMEFLNYSANTSVYIKKTGPAECMPGDTISYTVKTVQNTSTIPLSDFYWRDILPADAVRLTQLVTGTYNQALMYKVMITINKGDTRIIADNLSTTKNNVIDCSNVSLGLKNDEYVISFTFLFGTVKAGFAQVEQPQIFVKTLTTLPNGYEFVNKADVGGKYGREWIINNSTTLCKTFKKVQPLPRTGY